MVSDHFFVSAIISLVASHSAVALGMYFLAAFTRSWVNGIIAASLAVHDVDFIRARIVLIVVFIAASAPISENASSPCLVGCDTASEGRSTAPSSLPAEQKGIQTQFC